MPISKNRAIYENTLYNTKHSLDAEYLASHEPNFHQNRIPEFHTWYSSASIQSIRKYNYACIRQYYFEYYFPYNDLQTRFKSVSLYMLTKSVLVKLRKCSKLKDDLLTETQTPTSMDKINTPELFIHRITMDKF